MVHQKHSADYKENINRLVSAPEYMCSVCVPGMMQKHNNTENKPEEFNTVVFV